MNVLVCVKRVPDTGAKMVLTDDEQQINTRNLGFTVSPHEECAVEEAVQLVETHGGSSTVLTLGPPDAEEQLRESLAKGIDEAVLLEADQEWDPQATARAISDAVRQREADGEPIDLVLFGNEASDTADYQVPVRVAKALDRPCATSIKAIELGDGTVRAKRELGADWEVYELDTPAVLAVMEGLNLPRHPSLRGTMTAKKKPIDRQRPQPSEAKLEKVRLKHPPEEGGQVEILGQGPDAAPKVVEILQRLEVL
jgi:electron transfer flavoprotein beta subunit